MEQTTATLIVGLTAAGGSTTIGLASLIYAAHSNRMVLENQRRLARDERRWDMQRQVEQEVSEWLAAHPLLGTDDPLYEHHPFAAHTTDPGLALLSRTRQYASDEILAALNKLHEHGYAETNMAKAARIAAGMDGGYTGAFEDSSVAKLFKWQDPNDTQRDLQAQRDAWQAAWHELEAALRAGHQELAPVAPRPAFRRPSRKVAAALAVAVIASITLLLLFI